MIKSKRFKQLLLITVALISVNFIASKVYERFDLTQDKRFTLSEATKNAIAKVEYPLVIDVLLKGDFPAEFKKLQIETRQLLEEFNALNKNIKFSFVNPLEDQGNAEAIIDQLNQLGLTPANVTVEEGGKVSQELIFPWAMANLDTKTVKVPLLNKKLVTDSQQRVNNSIQQLEYVFADAITKLTTPRDKTVAIIKGNGELDDLYIADFLKTLQEYYNIAPFTLDSVANAPERTLSALKDYDLAIVAKPTEVFSDQEKYVMDQYITNGGKSLWLIDKVSIELDSLYANNGKSLAFQRDLNLDDLFFRYGVRINPTLINDIYCTQIVLTSGEGNTSQYNPYPWVYAPMVFSPNNHPINNNIEALRFQFSNTMDTLANGIKKRVLLRSSPLTKIIGTPAEVSLNTISQAPKKEEYTAGAQNVAVLLEGAFPSAFKNRIKPIKLQNNINDGVLNKMIVISDGDLIKNQLRQGVPLDLGYDKWTNSTFGNKEFLLNSVNYLLDDTGLINIRSKEIAIPFLDKEKMVAEKSMWQLLNLGLPLLLLGLFSLVFSFIKKRSHSRK